MSNSLRDGTGNAAPTTGRWSMEEGSGGGGGPGGSGVGSHNNSGGGGGSSRGGLDGSSGSAATGPKELSVFERLQVRWLVTFRFS